MGFVKTGETEMQVYLTEFGKNTILQRTFNPTQFTINDADADYLGNVIMDKNVADISGDYDDNVFALSKYRNIKGSVIWKVRDGIAPPPVPVPIAETPVAGAVN